MVRHSAPVSRPWFIRKRSQCGCQLSPASPAGWLLTGGYVLFAAAISALLLIGGDEPQLLEWAVWGLLLGASTFAYFLTAWRTAEVRHSGRPASPASGYCGTTGTWKDGVRPLLLGLVAALAIIGGALLGVEL